MKCLEGVRLSNAEYAALSEIKRLLGSSIGVKRLVLFGSVTRGERDKESDIDLLVLTHVPMERAERHQITDLICDVNLHFGTNFSTLVVDENSWEHGMVSHLPIKKAIEEDGMPL